jgi:hypothetical protein
MRARVGAAATAGWALAGAAVAFVHDRWWGSPNLAFMVAISRNLGHNPFHGGLNGDYLLTDLLPPVLARVTHQTDAHQYARLHLILLAIGLAIAVVLAARRFGHRVAGTLSVVLAMSPAVTVSLMWLGQPDPLTLSFGLIITLVRRPWIAALVAVLAGLTHPEQAIVMSVAAGVARAALAEERPRGPALARSAIEVVWVAGGVVVGRLITEVYLRVNDIVITNPRTSYLDLGFSGFLRSHREAPGALVYALWGPLWIVFVGVIVIRLVQRRSRADHDVNHAWWVVAAIALVALVPTFVTLDETRVYAMITAPALVLIAVLVPCELDRFGPRVLPWTGAVTLVTLLFVPGVFTAGMAAWSFDVHTAQFGRFLWDGRHPGDLTQWLFSPFHFVIPKLH